MAGLQSWIQSETSARATTQHQHKHAYTHIRTAPTAIRDTDGHAYTHANVALPLILSNVISIHTRHA